MAAPEKPGAGVTALPLVIDQSLSDDGVELRLHVDAGHHCFSGHFPGFPLVPGVVQVAWAVQLAEQFLPAKGAVQTLDRLKFMRPICPGDTISLTLQRVGADQVRFAYRNDDLSLAAGRLLYVQ